MILEIESFLNEDENKVYQKYKNKIPFKIVEFACDIGIDVFEDDLADNLSGKLERNQNGKFTIYLNASHSATRKIFTVAHELGHYFRHKSYFNKHNSLEEFLFKRELHNTFHKDREHYTDEEKRRESEANEFAAEILMPSMIVKDKWAQFNNSVSKMARYFNVSEIAIAFRIKNIIGQDYTSEYLIV